MKAHFTMIAFLMFLGLLVWLLVMGNLYKLGRQPCSPDTVYVVDTVLIEYYYVNEDMLICDTVDKTEVNRPVIDGYPLIRIRKNTFRTVVDTLVPQHLTTDDTALFYDRNDYPIVKSLVKEEK